MAPTAKSFSKTPTKSSIRMNLKKQKIYLGQLPITLICKRRLFRGRLRKWVLIVNMIMEAQNHLTHLAAPLLQKSLKDTTCLKLMRIRPQKVTILAKWQQKVETTTWFYHIWAKARPAENLKVKKCNSEKI